MLAQGINLLIFIENSTIRQKTIFMRLVLNIQMKPQRNAKHMMSQRIAGLKSGNSIKPVIIIQLQFLITDIFMLSVEEIV
jgi:hypothetical protein